MNRNNDMHDVLNNLSNVRREILQLCNAQGTEATDFHALGFDCLLKKLREIEKILTGLREMPITAHSTPHAARYQPVAAEPELHFNQCYPEARPNPERLTLTLPDDLTPHTKQVLNEIYAKFDRSFDEFYENAKLKLKQSFEDSFRKIDCYMNSFREKQKAEIRTFIENVLEDSSFVPPPDTFFGDLSYVPPRQPHQPPPPAGNASAPMINMEAVRQTLECPGVDPRLRQQFFAQLNDLNDVLSEIVDQADRRCPLPQREAPARPPPIPEVPQAESEDTQFQPLTCTR